MIRRLIFTLLTLMIPAAAQASTVLDVESMLARPGVRLVVVEFYATWCKPCMDAIPRWDALHKKYYDEGQAHRGQYPRPEWSLADSPGWTPDDMVCDIDGRLAKRMGDNLVARSLFMVLAGQSPGSALGMSTKSKKQLSASLGRIRAS